MKGVSLAVLAAVLFGASTPLSKGLLGNLPPQLLAGLLYFSSGVLLSVWNVFRGQTQPVPDDQKLWLFLAIFCGGVLGPVLLLNGLLTTPASTASLLLNLEGVLTAVLAWFVFRENFDRRIFLGMLCIVAGGLLLSWRGSAGWGQGVALVVAACLCWALDNNFMQKVSAGDPLNIAALKGLSAGGFNLVLATFMGQARWPDWTTLGSAAVIGALGYGVSLACFVSALRHLGTARTGAYFSLAPFVGASLSLLLYREPVTRQFLGAALCMAIGVYLHLTEKHEHDHTHEELEHEHEHVHDDHHQHEHEPGVDVEAPHTHRHRHARLVHKHPHYPDLHHRHDH